MPDERELETLADRADEAAAAGDYAAAERILDELAGRQQALLGAGHPDLANTLNNLGIVQEMVGKPDEAEQHFRQAWAIASAALAPDHPLVATSRTNLEEFCAARGRPLDGDGTRPVAGTGVGAPEHEGAGLHDFHPEPGRAEPPAAEAPAPAAEFAFAPMPGPVPEPERAGTGTLRWALLAAAVVAAIVAGSLWLRPASEPVPPSAEGSADVVAPPVAAPATPRENALEPPRPAGSEAPPPARAEAPALPAEPPSPAPEPPPAARAAAAGAVSVVDARLCRSLSRASAEWQCESPGAPVNAGRLIFYTRLRTPSDTTVSHRWYFGDRLRQAVSLKIGTNMSAGYRTFSAAAPDAGEAGEWRIELRTADGGLLHEERFTVR